MPEPFVKFELEKELTKLKLLPKATAALQEEWEVYRRVLRELAASGGAIRVRHHVVDPLLPLLGYNRIDDGGSIETREGSEDAGQILVADDGSSLRVWTASFDEDLYAPTRRGAAFRFSHLRRAQRVLLAAGEHVGLVTNGAELMLLISDPARPESTVTFSVDPDWKRSREVPDSFRLLIALTQPEGIQKLADIVDKARLQQARVTKELRKQAKRAIESFIQGVVDHPANADWREREKKNEGLANDLWHEGLILVYRLLFILKLESSDDPARSFSFASTSLWRNTFSPSIALAPYVRRRLDGGSDTGALLENGLRTLFHLFEQGLECTELVVKPLGGALFGKSVMPILSERVWGECAVAELLDQILWTTPTRGSESRERVHYGPLDVEDLGRVYEALLELEPGIATEPMCRLRRQKLEVVVTWQHGERYRQAANVGAEGDNSEDDETEDSQPTSRNSKVKWVEDIAIGTFYLRIGVGRKATGSYYTPHSFVRFLVQETLGPKVSERSQSQDPNPLAILKLKVLDPAMGSGHFLVETCRFLGEKLYEACRLCDEKALVLERDAEKVKGEERNELLSAAAIWRQRVIDLPDPDDALLKYLPSRSPGGEESGLSQRIAMAICRRLVATHCVYGVDKNPLAVELSKLALWLESHAEGMPLTFLDHRLVVGDSLTGTTVADLTFKPSQPSVSLEDLFAQELNQQLHSSIDRARALVCALERTVGSSLLEVEEKARLKADLDHTIRPFWIAGIIWSGGVMLGKDAVDDDAYRALLQNIATTGRLPRGTIPSTIRRMLTRGLGAEGIPDTWDEVAVANGSRSLAPALPYELTFPDVFFRIENADKTPGFDAVLGNPPWDKLRVERRDLMASIDPVFMEGKEAAGVGDEHGVLTRAFQKFPNARRAEAEVVGTKRIFSAGRHSGIDLSVPTSSMGDADQYRLFLMSAARLLRPRGTLGFVVGGGLAKNPADAPTRRFVFSAFGVSVFAHFLNLRQLFDGASSRVSFVVIVATKSWNVETVKIAFDLTTFDDLGSIPAVAYAQLQSAVQGDGDITKAGSDAHVFSGISNAVSALKAVGIEVGNDLHRTSAKPALRDLGEVIAEASDARRDDVVVELLRRGFACSYDGRSFDQFNSCPVEKSGKWDPTVRIVADLRHVMLRPIRNRLRFYRLAWRSTCGHPKTNERSARACILPPGTVAANSVLLERLPANRANAQMLIACGVINSFTFDAQARRVVQSNLNESVMATLRWPQMSPSVQRFIAHQTLRLVYRGPLFDELWREQLPGIDPRRAEDTERNRVVAALDATVAFAYGLSATEYDHVVRSFRFRRSTLDALILTRVFDELLDSGIERFNSQHDPFDSIPLVQSFALPVLNLPDFVPVLQTEQQMELKSSNTVPDAGESK